MVDISYAMISDAIIGETFFKMIPAILMSIAIFIFVVWFIGMIQEAVNPKSKKYRTLMKDIYVVGVIKQKAKEKGIDLVEELKEFAKIVKKSELRRRDLDNIVESELNEEISNDFEQQQEAKQDKKKRKPDTF